MRPRNLLILALAVVALGAFIWFFERDLPSTEERQARAKLALGLEADEIVALVIERPGETPVRLERPPAEGDEEPGEWRLEGDFRGRADADAVDSLATSLALLERSRTLDEVDAEATGLAEPRARLTVVTAEGEQLWRVGSAVPKSDTMIVQREGAEEALVVSDLVFDELAKPAGSWRSRDLLAADREEISRVTLARGSESVALARRDDEFWLEEPIVDRADGDAVAELLADLTGLEAEEFVDEPGPASELGLEPPAAAVEVVRADGERFRLELGSPVVESEASDADDAVGPASRYARTGEQVVILGDALATALERTPGEWQAKGWSAFDSWQVETLTARDGEGELELVRDGGDWLRDGEVVPYNPVSDLLYALDSATGESLVSAASVELGEPVLELVVAGEDRAETLRLYATGEGGAPAAAEGRDYLVMLAAGTVDDLKLKIAEVRSAEPDSVEDAVDAIDAVDEAG